MDLLPFFEWCEATWLGQTVRTSEWLFPIIETFHLLGLCLLGGSLLVVDLRMLGLGLTDQSIAHVHHDAKRWLNTAVVAMIATGVPLFLSEAVKCYYNQSFWVKMVALPVVVLMTYTIRARVAATAVNPTDATRGMAIGSLAGWFVVAAAGRWIGFS